MTDPTTARVSPERSALDHLRALVPGSHRRMGRVAAMTVVATAMESIVLLLVVGAAIGPALENDDANGILAVAADLSQTGRLVLTVVACVVLTAMHVLVARVAGGLARDVVHATREQAVDRYLGAPWAVQQLEGEGRLQETVSSLCVQSSGAGLSLAGEIAGGLSLAVLLAASVAVDPLATAIVVALGAGTFAALRPLARATQVNATDFVLANAAYNEGVSRIASMARELKAFGVERQAGAALGADNLDVADRMRRMRFTTRIGGELYRDSAMLLLAVIIGVMSTISDALVGRFAAVLLLAVRSLSYATTLQSNRQVLREQLPNLVELRARLDRLAAVERSGDVRIDGFRELRLDGVGYRYADGRRALAGVAGTIRAGDFVLVVGPSGAGKSTLLDVLIGLRTPTEGRVEVDGNPLGEIQRASWSRLVGFVPQEPSLLRGTVRDNITFLRTGFTDDEITEAARAASVLDDVLRLPDGFDTELGPRGAGLSGGQKQRVAIARALLGRPALLVLDEPNSALDRAAQQAVESTIADLRGRVTVVLVTHREVLGQATPDLTIALEPPPDAAVLAPGWPGGDRSGGIDG